MDELQNSNVHSIGRLKTLLKGMSCLFILLSLSVMPEQPELLVSRHLVGSGHDWGGLATEITNSATHTVEVLYLEMVPWFFRLYLHTLSVSQGVESFSKREHVTKIWHGLSLLGGFHL